MSVSKGKKREIKDTWKMKKWYEVIAPPVFGEVSIGSTPALDPKDLIGRVIEATLYDITGDYTQVHIKLRFQIIKVEGHNAYTRFKGHELARDYIKVLTRRKSSKVQGIFNVETKDGYKLRITAITFASFKAKTSQKRAIRKVMEKIITEKSKEKTFDELVQAMIGDEITSEIFNEAKKIFPVRKVEIYKSKLLYIPGPYGPEKAVVIRGAKQSTQA